MITSVFKKSTPINYSFIGIMILLFFFVYQFQDTKWTNSLWEIGKKAGLLLILFASVFLSNFIVKKNGLTKDSAFTILFYFLFLLFFPKVLDNYNLILANFFILLVYAKIGFFANLKSTKRKNI